MPKYRTITLTDRAPIKIDEEAWTVVARGRQSWHDNQYEFQANRKVDVQILVRQHQDGRAVVYGYVDFDSNYQNEPSYVERAGVIVACGGDLARAIRDVASSLADQAGGEAERIGVAKRDCIADLPAEVLS